MLSLSISKYVLEVFLASFLLSRSSEILRDVQVAHASLIVEPARHVFRVLAACIRTQGLPPNSERLGEYTTGHFCSFLG